jgi:hypothetical protein
MSSKFLGSQVDEASLNQNKCNALTVIIVSGLLAHDELAGSDLLRYRFYMEQLGPGRE